VPVLVRNQQSPIHDQDDPVGALQKPK